MLWQVPRRGCGKCHRDIPYRTYPFAQTHFAIAKASLRSCCPASVSRITLPMCSRRSLSCAGGRSVWQTSHRQTQQEEIDTIECEIIEATLVGMCLRTRADTHCASLPVGKIRIFYVSCASAIKVWAILMQFVFMPCGGIAEKLETCLPKPTQGDLPNSHKMSSAVRVQFGCAKKRKGLPAWSFRVDLSQAVPELRACSLCELKLVLVANATNNTCFALSNNHRTHKATIGHATIGRAKLPQDMQAQDAYTRYASDGPANKRHILALLAVNRRLHRRSLSAGPCSG